MKYFDITSAHQRVEIGRFGDVHLTGLTPTGACPAKCSSLNGVESQFVNMIGTAGQYGTPAGRLHTPLPLMLWILFKGHLEEKSEFLLVQ